MGNKAPEMPNTNHPLPPQRHVFLCRQHVFQTNTLAWPGEKSRTNEFAGPGCCHDDGAPVALGGHDYAAVLLECGAFVCDFIVSVDCHGLSDYVWGDGDDEGCLEEDSAASIGSAEGG